MATSKKSLKPNRENQAFAAETVSPSSGWSSRGTSTAQHHATGFAISLMVHVAALGIAGLIRLSLPEDADLPMICSAWSEATLPVELNAEAEPLLESMSAESGGRTVISPSMLLESDRQPVNSVERPLWSAMTVADVQSEAWSAADLLSLAGESPSSSGQGRGLGNGSGDGKGFFGLSPQVGQKIVFVVDNSRSMNHPHDSEAKTRFRRLKMELVQSIWAMRPEQEFYVIFFNQETDAMPSMTMQSATQAAKEKYLSWVAAMKASGAPTDPRQAIGLALKFQPDVIYFLTDGEFHKIVNRKLVRIKQRRTTIHTFAFGERIGEAVLEEMAKNNQGKYTFIP